MSSKGIEFLLRKPDEIVTENHVVDFLNTHFKELEDLEQLDSTLTLVEAKQQNLAQKLSTMKAETSKTLNSSLGHLKVTEAQLENLQATRLELEDALTEHQISIGSKKNENASIESAVVSKELVDDLIILQKNVENLLRAKQYLNVLVIADELSNDQILKNLDGFIRKNLDALWEDMKSRLSKKFQQTLDSLGWPTPLKIPLPNEMQEKKLAFTKAFCELLLLQNPTGVEDRLVEDTEKIITKEHNEELVPLFPIQLMAEPLITRFRYHFDTKRPTNRIDKPEWYFTHLLTALHEHSPFLTEEIQVIIDEAGFEKYNAKDDFIRCLLTAVTRKLNQSVNALVNSPQNFSHTVFETLQFDQVIRTVHLYLPPGKKQWNGCVEVFTGRKEIFKAWLKIEKEFAEVRYNEIMHSEDAWEIESEDIVDDDLQPTKSASKIMDLLELVTSMFLYIKYERRYKLLPMFHNRIRFMVDIQAEILDAYEKRIESAVKAFENLSYTIVRAVPNAATADGKSVTGIDGLKRLCRWLSSAGYVSRTIREWGEDPFFLELWHDVNVRAAMNTSSTPLPSPTNSEKSVSEESSGTGLLKNDQQELVDDGTIFDDAADTYDDLCDRIQILMVKIVSKEFINGLKAYSKKNNWSRAEVNNYESSETPLNRQSHLRAEISLESSASKNISTNNTTNSAASTSDETPANTTIIEISSELYTPLSQLTHVLTFLSNSLPSRIFNHVYKEISKDIEDYLWERVLMKSQFSEMGGWQFEVDMEKGLFMVGKRIRDACILLTLSSSSSDALVDPDKSKKPKTISQVISFLSDTELKSNTGVRILEQLGVFHLNVKEAKEVIGRRIDCWN
ncbi:5609_t:CDS:10 [Ambispora gerdemannii]|uniref:5609_t:CDS:1 n=1 Tax=Ambispora gerdemannii TaxID=144530 RepID=A0A9N8ZHW9_9GLOM|nr:5609_t:CDS:10 [Ambispora gerdemannii]